jgi:hypothetical protein
MDTGATAIFIMEGTPVENKQIATKPLTINLPKDKDNGGNSNTPASGGATTDQVVVCCCVVS